MSTLPIHLLERFRVDRQTGVTADGSTHLVVLVLKASDATELAVAISKSDAMIIAVQLMNAAGEAQMAMW
jgi:hypothetical protein